MKRHQPLGAPARAPGPLRTGESRSEIEGRRNGDRLRLSVRDNGPGVTATPNGGIGLANTRARLAQLYGARASLALASLPDGGAIATITIPVHE